MQITMTVWSSLFELWRENLNIGVSHRIIKLFVFLPETTTKPCFSNIKRVILKRIILIDLSLDLYEMPWNSMLMWEEMGGSNDVNSSCLWKSAKSFYPPVAQTHSPSRSGELHASIFEYMWNLSLGVGVARGVFIISDWPLLKWARDLSWFM